MKVKIGFAGEGGVGKTSFIKREIFDKFNLPEATIGVDFYVKDYLIGQSIAKVILWDKAGGESFRPNFYLKGMHSHMQTPMLSVCVSASMIDILSIG